ncbi:MAG: hypothetical protein HW388_441, partial [Dehalococcoidia bacterium]|nr:hypothetical protein [Dehalococcoidia bacterium]
MCGLTNSEIGGGSGDNERLSETEAVYEQRYQELSKDLRELVARYERSHNGALDHLLKYFVSPHLPTTTQEVRELSLLIDTSQDERPIQSYLESHPHILTRKLQPGHHGQFCIPKPRLGSDLIPDFLVAEVDSAGIWWFGVELESPQERMFKRDGDPTSTL